MLWVQVQESGLTFSGLIAPHVGGVFHTCLLGWSLLTVSAWQGAYISALSFALSSLVFLFLNLSEGEGGQRKGEREKEGEGRESENESKQPSSNLVDHPHSLGSFFKVQLSIPPAPPPAPPPPHPLECSGCSRI